MSRTARVLPVVLLALSLFRLAAQEPASTAFGQGRLALTDTSPLTAADPGIQPARRGARPHAEGPIAERILRAGPGGTPDRVLFDEPGDGRIWAAGATYKASFGADGFVYVPFFGSAAPQNYPIQFVLRSVRVGGRDVQFAAGAMAARAGARVTFDRGPVRELYDLTARTVEQTFVVDATAPGDVDVELEVVTELTEDTARAGLQFCNHLGHVAYGTAWLVSGATRSEIPASLSDRTLRLHVPAAQRGTGPVVIDPIINTVPLTPTVMDSALPDIAYDATTDRWAVVWVYVFSATDHDVVAELRGGNGEPIDGSFTAIDSTTVNHSFPRVANLNSADRFLIVVERIAPRNLSGHRHRIFGRTLNAAAPFALSPAFAIHLTGADEQTAADVGGDPGGGSRWTVVFVDGIDVVARQVEVNGTPNPNTILVKTGPHVCASPQISLSNGNGLTPTPCWCIVYLLQVSATDWDIFGSILDPNGVVTKPHTAISSGPANDLYTTVSSPLTDTGNGPAFLVASERQEAAGSEMVVKLVDANLNAVVPEVNLTKRYGFKGTFSRVESDGCRFAAMSRIGSASLGIGTLALVGNDLVLHEAIVSLGAGDTPFLAAKRSGGGGSTDYGIVFTEVFGSPDRAYLGLYEGRAANGGFRRRTTGCGLDLDNSGRPFLREVVSFTIPNPGTDLVGLLLGVPAAATPLCPSCSFGLDPARPLIFFPAPLSLPLPPDSIFVGCTLAVQGFGIGSGPCAGPFRVSDTIDFTIQ